MVKVWLFIYLFIIFSEGEPGMHVDQIRRALKPMTQQMFAQALETLQNDGKIYQTIDEEHYGLVQ